MKMAKVVILLMQNVKKPKQSYTGKERAKDMRNTVYNDKLKLIAVFFDEK